MYVGQALRPPRCRCSRNLDEPARGSKGEYPGVISPHGLGLARGDDGSGEVSLDAATLLPGLGRLNRIRDSEGHILYKQAHMRVIRRVACLSGSAQGVALRVARVARPCGAGKFPGHGTGEDP